MSKQTKILVGLFFLLVVAFLIGNRLGASWAGGPGYEAPLVLAVQDVQNGNTAFTYPRGSIIETDSGEWIHLVQGDLQLWMYENTRLEIRQLTKKVAEFYVTKGRVIVAHNSNDRSVTIASNEVEAALPWSGSFSFVNYDFQQRVSVIPLQDSFVQLWVHDQPASLPTDRTDTNITNEPMDISEVAPYNITKSTFNPAGSAAEGFYQWWEESTK